MYRFSYAEVLDDTPQTARARERMALTHSIELFQTAMEHGINSRETLEALHFCRRLWATLLEDLASEDNQLSQQLRADLISVGLWIMREADEIRLGRSTNFKGLIEVTNVISEGLQ